MAKSLVDQFVESEQGMRAFQQERAIYQVTELIEKIMSEQGVSRSELAARLGKTKGWVTQLLDGEANKTVRTLADVLCVLGHDLRFSAEPLAVEKRPRARLNGHHAAANRVAPKSAARKMRRQSD